jgi:ProP effector
MSNTSLKEQLQAIASQLSDKLGEEHKRQSKQKSRQSDNINKSNKSNKAKPKWLDHAHYGVELLKAYFPSCFKAANEVQPLKKGIKQDLVKSLSTIDTIVTEDKACMVKTLAYYVNTVAYHKSVVEGATRVDLEGNPAGIVSAEEAKYSAERQQTKLRARQTTTPNLQTKTKDEITL